MATLCSCEWQVVQIAAEVAPVLLRAATDQACPFPHRDEARLPAES